MALSFTKMGGDLIALSAPIRESLSKLPNTLPPGSSVSIKSIIESLIPAPNSLPSSEKEFQSKIKDFSLCCAALASFEGSPHEQLSWIPNPLSLTANSAFQQLSKAFSANFEDGMKFGDWNLDLKLVSDERKLAVVLIPELLPLLKDKIKESSIDKSDDADEISAATARAPVAHAIVAAHQFRWFASQVDYPNLGKLSSMVIPCALTALDHWSPQVKGQGMITFRHLAANVNAAELGWYEDVILDACCQNIACDDEIWQYVVETTVSLVTLIQRSNPRSSCLESFTTLAVQFHDHVGIPKITWKALSVVLYEKILNEMLSHLERQPRNKERRIAWLKHVEPLFNGLGLVILAHFRRIFPLFFKWMHADDDETVLLVLDQVKTVIKLTWIRNSPHIERLVDELVILHKEAALRVAREDIRERVLQILILLQLCKGLQFEKAWDKHKDDPNLTTFGPSFGGRNTAAAVP